MEALKQRILQDGTIIDNRILKIDNFLNHQIDTDLVLKMGEEFAKRLKDVRIDRIVTIEASGIAVAFAASVAMGNKPLVFARKKKSLLTAADVYMTDIYSYTKEETYRASISRNYIKEGEKNPNYRRLPGQRGGSGRTGKYSRTSGSHRSRHRHRRGKILPTGKKTLGRPRIPSRILGTN